MNREKLKSDAQAQDLIVVTTLSDITTGYRQNQHTIIQNQRSSTASSVSSAKSSGCYVQNQLKMELPIKPLSSMINIEKTQATKRPEPKSGQKLNMTQTGALSSRISKGAEQKALLARKQSINLPFKENFDESSKGLASKRTICSSQDFSGIQHFTRSCLGPQFLKELKNHEDLQHQEDQVNVAYHNAKDELSKLSAQLKSKLSKASAGESLYYSQYQALMQEQLPSSHRASLSNVPHEQMQTMNYSIERLGTFDHNGLSLQTASFDKTYLNQTLSQQISLARQKNSVISNSKRKEGNQSILKSEMTQQRSANMSNLCHSHSNQKSAAKKKDLKAKSKPIDKLNRKVSQPNLQLTSTTPLSNMTLPAQTSKQQHSQKKSLNMSLMQQIQYRKEMLLEAQKKQMGQSVLKSQELTTNGINNEGSFSKPLSFAKKFPQIIRKQSVSRSQSIEDSQSQVDRYDQNEFQNMSPTFGSNKKVILESTIKQLYNNSAQTKTGGVQYENQKKDKTVNSRNQKSNLNRSKSINEEQLENRPNLVFFRESGNLGGNIKQNVVNQTCSKILETKPAQKKPIQLIAKLNSYRQNQNFDSIKVAAKAERMTSENSRIPQKSLIKASTKNDENKKTQQIQQAIEGVKIEEKQTLQGCKSPDGFKKNLFYNKPKTIKRDKAYTVRILFHLIKFLDVDTLIKIAQTSKNLSKTREVKCILNSQFKSLVIRGLSTHDRAKYWNYRTRFVYYRKKYKGLFNKIVTEKKSDYHSDIQKDLDRTFPNLKHFIVLTAISIYYKKLGYVQGMNFIVGTVLLSFENEEDAFWMVVSMLVNFKLDQLLTFENNKFRQICFQIDMFVKAYLPNLHNIFKENNLSSEFYASQWLFTFFSIDLSFDIVFIAIDLFLLEGYSAFIRVCLTLLKLIENELNELSFDESLVYLKTFGRHLETDVEKFYELAMTFKISKQMCKDLEKFFHSGKELHELELDRTTNKWTLVSAIDTLQAETKYSDDTQSLNDKLGGLRAHSRLNKDYNSEKPKTTFNPIGAFSNKITKFFHWFKKDKEGEIEDEMAALNISEDNVSHSSHRSADIDDPATTYHHPIL